VGKSRFPACSASEPSHLIGKESEGRRAASKEPFAGVL
jgi:hypothetical protein